MTYPGKRKTLNRMHSRNTAPASAAVQLLEELLQSGLINSLALDALPETSRAELAPHSHDRQLLARLADLDLLTSFQADQIRIGNVQSLILGNFLVLGRLSVGKPARRGRSKGPIPARSGPQADAEFFERKTAANLCHPSDGEGG
jgi:hypothetical protein